ncbi:MAG TPA: UDP-N-acetylmuramate dehydrogenase [Alphaproteobacteria bacterium]|nr:UDP-N-acetylmuramate dehydrogenase [Alphaproteobacteria bacterium]
MMALKRHMPPLIERLPAVRGRIVAGAPLARLTRFRVGGPAEVMFQPADRDDLVHFLAGKPAEVPLTVIGVGSNLLVRDGGVPGIVVRLGRAFAGIAAEGEEVGAGAAALDVNVAAAAAEAGLAGLEFLAGIPGTIGGAVRMNAGAYGREVSDVIVSAEALDASGGGHLLRPAELGLGYRRSALPADWIVLSASLRAHRGEYRAILKRMQEIETARAGSQPIRGRTGGSTFANPSAAEAGGRKAWQLIDAAGCRGLVRGGAAVSEQHCNFLINRGSASAGDLEALGEEIRRRVFETSGVELSWEIRIIGVPKDAGPRPLREGKP